MYLVLLLEGYEEQLSKEDDDIPLLDCQIDQFPTAFMHGRYYFNTEYKKKQLIR